MDLRNVIGLGVAGNFTGNLEQAGEASDFVGVEVTDDAAPKGLFPFYIPGADDHFLGTFPIDADRIAPPSPDDKLQIEPEVGLLCDLEYDGQAVTALRPRRFGAHNDCSIRREGARKISEKKNWGPASKGISKTLLEIDHFEAGGVLDHYRIASFLRRDGALHDYGQDSAVSSYSYFHQRLLDWIVGKMNTQVDAGPLECIADWIARAHRPDQALISIGATRYTDFGEQTFLASGDEAVVAVYDGRRHDAAAIREALDRGARELDGASLLVQRVS